LDVMYCLWVGNVPMKTGFLC